MSTTYRFTFDAPNNFYHLSVFKYACTIPAEMTETDLNLLFELNNGEVDRRLYTPGTYYVKITCPASRVSDENYLAEAVASKTNNYFPLYKKSMKDYKAAIWENDYIPDTIENRWDTNTHELCGVDTYPISGAHKTGYFDPIFKGPIEYQVQKLNRMMLDSVIYVWGHDELEMLAGALQQLQVAIRQLRLNQLRNMQVQSDINHIAGATFALILRGFHFGALAESAETLFTGEFESTFTAGNSNADNVRTIVTSILDLVLGNGPEALDSFTIMDSALSLLIGECDGLSGDPMGVVAIPVYAEMAYYTVALKDHDRTQRNITVYKKSFVPYNSKLYNAGTNDNILIPTNKFRYDRITEVQELGQLIDGVYVPQKTFHGTIKPFTSMDAFKQYIKYDQLFDVTSIVK